MCKQMTHRTFRLPLVGHVLCQGGKIMGPKPRISLEDTGKVLALSEEGYSQRVIAVRVARL